MHLHNCGWKGHSGPASARVEEFLNFVGQSFPAQALATDLHPNELECCQIGDPLQGQVAKHLVQSGFRMRASTEHLGIKLER